MSSALVMDSGPGKLRYVVIGGIVAVFAVGIMAATRQSESKKLELPAAKAPAVQAAAVPKPAPAPAPQALPEPEPMTVASTADAPPVIDDAAAPAPAAAPVEAPSAAAAEPAPVAEEAPIDWNAASQASEEPSALAELTGEAAPRVRAVEKPRPAVRAPPPPALGALQPWWREGASRAFAVEYVGQAAQEQALVFRFSKNVGTADAAARNIHIVDGKGQTVQGAWSKGNNPYVLVYRGVNPGRYTVSIDSALASANGTTLGTALRGPVYVR